MNDNKEDADLNNEDQGQKNDRESNGIGDQVQAAGQAERGRISAVTQPLLMRVLPL